MVDLNNVRTVTIGGRDVASIKMNNRLVWEAFKLTLTKESGYIVPIVTQNGQPVSDKKLTLYTSIQTLPTIGINDDYATIAVAPSNDTQYFIFEDAQTITIFSINYDTTQLVLIVNNYTLDSDKAYRIQIKSTKVILEQRIESSTNYTAIQQYDISNSPDALYFGIPVSASVAEPLTGNYNQYPTMTPVNVFLKHEKTLPNGKCYFTFLQQHNTEVTCVIDGTNISATTTI